MQVILFADCRGSYTQIRSKQANTHTAGNRKTPPRHQQMELDEQKKLDNYPLQVVT